MDYLIIGWLLFIQAGVVLLIAVNIIGCIGLTYIYFGAIGVVVLVASLSVLIAIVAHFAKEK